jgi:hypothetical protein
MSKTSRLITFRHTSRLSMRGTTEAAKGIYMQRHILKIDRLVDYARRLGNGAV